MPSSCLISMMLFFFLCFRFKLQPKTFLQFPFWFLNLGNKIYLHNFFKLILEIFFFYFSGGKLLYFNVYFKMPLVITWTSLVAQSVKNMPAVHETPVRSLGWEDSLEKEMATHSSILAWKISWTEEPGGLPSMGSQRVGHYWATNTYLLT